MTHDSASAEPDGSAVRSSLSRRRLLQTLGAAGTALAFPHVWIKNAHAQTATAGHGTAKHVVYIRLSGGFRFTCAYNGDVADEFNPFGRSNQRAEGTEWGVSALNDRASWLDGADGEARRELGMRPVSQFSNEICVFPCVDHEPLSGRADGNHGTGLERYYTGYVGGSTAFFTYINYGLRNRPNPEGKTLLPAFSLGDAGMATGAGPYAAFRPPVLEGADFDRFGFDSEASLPAWATNLANNVDTRLRDRLHLMLRTPVEAYQQTRRDTKEYGKIFQDELLRVQNRSTEQVDGISNRELEDVFGTDGTARRVALALRLFHFGCPAVYLNQGGYDMHSNEEQGLPAEMDELNRLISGLNAALKRMTHPEGGTYWDHTVVVLGSEFGRTTNGSRFNSGRGSDHSSDLATRWMSMPMMGGPILAAGKGGRSLGGVSAADLKATGKVYSYRSVCKTLLDMLGAEPTDVADVFPADRPIEDLFS